MVEQTLRIIDANLNRMGEGLRVLEDAARFLLNNAALSEELKALRHELTRVDKTMQGQLLSARRSEEDVAAFINLPTEAEREGPLAIVKANALRVQESLRVLEEFSKMPALATTLDWEKFKQARFALYELERRLTSALLRRDKAEKIAGLYVIVDGEALGGRDEAEVASQAIRGGAKVIQLRDKQRSMSELLPIARKLKRVCAEAGVLYIVNDYVDLALAADADGVHVGQKDLPVKEVRSILPIDKIIGCSAATLDEAIAAEAAGADYIAVGSIYPTSSKADTRPAGLETLRQVVEKVSLPVVAIGGINQTNVSDVIKARADAVAVISAVVGAEDVEEAARQLAAAVATKEQEKR